jgi:hypothetical protein
MELRETAYYNFRWQVTLCGVDSLEFFRATTLSLTHLVVRHDNIVVALIVSTYRLIPLRLQACRFKTPVLWQPKFSCFELIVDS